MIFRLHIHADSAAFEEEGVPVHELARILRETADRIEAEGVPTSYANLRDVNGNTCGAYRLRDEDES